MTTFYTQPDLVTRIVLVLLTIPVMTTDGSCISCVHWCSRTIHSKRAICSCSDRCLAWGNCCADFLQVCSNVTDATGYLATLKTNDNDAVELLGRYGKCNSYSDKGYIKVIGKCPLESGGYGNEECSETEKSRHLIPVRHKNNPYLNFANIHCALCHGYQVTNVTPWDFRFICPSKNNVTDLESIKNECYIDFLDTRPEELICYPVDRPFYTRPELDRTELDLLCRHTLAPVDFSDLIYKNRYCAQLDGVNETLECLIPEHSGGTRPDKNSLSVLFDMQTGTANIEQATIWLCAVNQIYDPLWSICRNLICPPKQYPWWGKCNQNETIFIDQDTQPFPDKNGTIRINFAHHFINDDFLEKVRSTDFVSETDVSESVHDRNSSENCRLEPKSDIKMVQVTCVFKNEISTTKYNDFLKMISDSPCVSQTTLSNMATEEVTCGEGYYVQLYTDVELKMVDDDLFVMVELKDQNIFYQLLSIGFKLPVHEYLTVGRAAEIHVCKQDSNSTLICPTIVFKQSEFEQQNDTIVIKHSNKVIPHDEFRIIDGQAYVCETLSSVKFFVQFFKFDANQQLVSVIVTAVSSFCLLLCLFVYIRFKEMQTLSGKLNACLCLWLLLAQLTILISGLEELVCRVIATICHFLWLAVFSQMSAIAVNMALTFHKITPIDSMDTCARFKRLTIAALTPPIVIVAVCTGLDLSLTDGVWKIGYGTNLCSWMSNEMKTIVIFFYTPVCLSLVFNFVCFVITLCGIEKSTKASSMVSHDTTRSERSRCVIYTKLSSIMGFTWITGVIAAIFDYPIIWYIFILLNGLQGFFIFLSFICNRRTANMLRHVFQTDRKNLYTSSTKPQS